MAERGTGSTDRVRLGLVGCGWIAAAHLRAIGELADRCSLVWAADPDAGRAGEIATRADCTKGMLMLELTPMRGGPAAWEWDARLAVQVRHEEEILYDGPAGFEFTPQLEHFLDCLAQETEPETGGAYARDLMAAIIQGYN